MNDQAREVPEQSTSSIETRYGTIHFPVGTDTISDSLRKYGEWAQSELDILCDFFNADDIVVDGGACYGTHSRAFSDRVGPNGQVVSFEPFDENRKILMLNAAAAELSNIEVRSVALGERAGKGKVTECFEENAGGTRVSATDESGSLTMVRLDDAVLGKVSFIKLDLEGGELSALRGATRMISQDRPVVFCEVLDLSSGAPMLRHMSEQGYVSFGLNTPAYRPDNFFGSNEDIFAGGSECGLLFLPAEKQGAFQERVQKHRLPKIETQDDLALLLLQQPQYLRSTMPGLRSASILEVPEVPRDVAKKLHGLEEAKETASAQLAVLQSRVKLQLAELLPLLETWKQDNEYIVRLAKRVRKLPWGLYFRTNKKHRRGTRNLINFSDRPQQALDRLAALQGLLSGVPVAESGAFGLTEGHRAKVFDAIGANGPEAVLAPLPKNIEPVLDASKIADALAAGRDRVVLGIGHDNYREVTGGTQICIQIEAERADAAGMEYLNIHPVRTCNALLPDVETENAIFRLVLNGECIGVARYADLIVATTERAAAGQSFKCVIHHLLGHSPEAVAQLIEASCDDKAHYWFHDYFAACQSYMLLRNNLSYCDAPDLGSQGCTICVFGQTRAAHMQRFRGFFDRIQVTGIAPSQVAADMWVKSCGYKLQGLIVQPHMVIKSDPRPTPLPKVGSGKRGPIRIAFVGVPLAHKGWEDFKALVESEALNSKFEFHYFGRMDVALSVVKHEVDVTASQTSDAMTRALAAAGIDLVLHFAPWPETFSLTTAEALASSAFVVTHEKSGNVAKLVKSTGRGVVLNSSADLLPWAKSDACEKLVDDSRQRRTAEVLTSEISDMAIPHLQETSAK